MFWVNVWLCMNVCLKYGKHKTIIIRSKKNKAMERKIKRKIKFTIYDQMVNFDQIILMPTLSINANPFLNQTFWSFCIICKNTSWWSLWILPTMQKHFPMRIIRIQSGNLLTETRSSQNWISSNQLNFAN